MSACSLDGGSHRAHGRQSVPENSMLQNETIRAARSMKVNQQTCFPKVTPPALEQEVRSTEGFNLWKPNNEHRLL